MAEECRGAGHDRLPQGGLLLPRAEVREVLAEGGRVQDAGRGVGRGGGGPARGTDQAPHERRHLVEVGGGGRCGQVGGDHQGFAERERGVEKVQGAVAGQGVDAAGADAAAAGVGEEVAGHALVEVPGAPGDGEGRQALGGPVLGEGVEEEVGGDVVGLAGAGGDAGDGGVEDEGVEAEAAGEVVQVPGGVRLGPQDGGQAVRCEGGDDGVVEDSGGVHDGGERVLGGDATEQ